MIMKLLWLKYVMCKWKNEFIPREGMQVLFLFVCVCLCKFKGKKTN